MTIKTSIFLKMLREKYLVMVIQQIEPIKKENAKLYSKRITL